MNEFTSPNDLAPEVDETLRAYFKSAMPSPWPEAPRETVTVLAAESRTWTMATCRAIVGASLVAILLGYLGLASFFPREKAGTLNPNGSNNIIGSNPQLDPAKATPMR
jgi:hypothetical protein